jgi:glycosyltransferase involved in cell wall biosynthesis
MRISGFSYIRNGFKYQYPFLQSIQSILPICDEFVIAVGQSDDGTREALSALQKQEPKLKIIDTIWDEKLRQSGKIFAQQANIALRECTGDWLFHIQADELIHEKDILLIPQTLAQINDDKSTNGILLDFLHFHGNYQHLDASRWRHPKEIRLIRNHNHIYSYKDSQGFRQYPSWESYNQNHKGLKIKVKHLSIPVYHYSYVRPAEAMQAKAQYFETFWHDEQAITKKYAEAAADFNYYDIDKVKRFEGSHPALMKAIVEHQNPEFNPQKIRGIQGAKLKFIYGLERLIGRRIGEYKNYKL